MINTQPCLICYLPLAIKETHCHASCCRKFFGKNPPTVLPYRFDELDELGKKIVRSSVTVPGVQAKLSLHLSGQGKNAGRLTLVGLWGNFILKPPVSRYPQMPEIEDITMHLARFFNIDTVPHALIPLQSGELAYITRRIDRDKNGDKLHMEDMCQLTGRLTEDKYKGSMEQVAKAIRKFSSNPGLDVLRFFEVTLFSFLTGNADMHLKNFSLIRDAQNFISYTPAYDMLATRLLITEKDDPEEMALTLNGKKSKFRLSDFMSFSDTIGLNKKQVENTFKRFSKNLLAAVAFIDLSLLDLRKKEEFKKLIFNRSEKLKMGA